MQFQDPIAVKPVSTPHVPANTERLLISGNIVIWHRSEIPELLMHLNVYMYNVSSNDASE